MTASNPAPEPQNTALTQALDRLDQLEAQAQDLLNRGNDDPGTASRARITLDRIRRLRDKLLGHGPHHLLIIPDGATPAERRRLINAAVLRAALEDEDEDDGDDSGEDWPDSPAAYLP